jgi:RimK family alpha-L-glutamate ligase
MKIAIFSHVASAYGPRRLKEEAQKLGLETYVADYNQVDIIIGKKGAEVYLEDKLMPKMDLVVFRSAGGTFYYVPQRDYLLDYFERQEATILNKKTYKLWSRLDKFTQQMRLAKLGLPFVESFLYGSRQRLEKKMFYPAVVKSYFGSQGKRVFKVESKKQLDKLLEEFLPGNLLIEPVLPEGEDIRVIVLGGKAIGAMKRIARPGQFLTNYSAGGMVEKFELDKTTRQLAEKAAKAFFLDYVGVDLMKDWQGQWRILEVNRACQFEGFEKSTGINVAKKVVEYLISKRRA